jgi:hypothetical protein
VSHQYIQRLRAVRGEFEAARQSISFVSRNWHKYDIYQDMNDVTPANFHRAGEYLFATYLIRLSAEFEGILKHHLTSNHPGVSVPKDAKVDWLISKVSKEEGFKTDLSLRINMARVRNYRNDFVHSGEATLAAFAFESALSWFNTFLANLPDPRT